MAASEVWDHIGSLRAGTVMDNTNTQLGVSAAEHGCVYLCYTCVCMCVGQ